MTNKALTLYELNSFVAEGIQALLPDDYWVEAELSEVRVVRGNCYMELVQKDLLGNTPIAKATAKCWRNIWPRVERKFLTTTRQNLQPGMKVMLLVHADFHEAYGFSWIVTDINPEFTMGDMLRKRNEAIAKLKAAGIFDLQRDLQLPHFAQNIAIISSSNAAGYGDFLSEINNSSLNFHLRLYTASMQGELVEESIIAALNKIYAVAESTDAVVIIRGGGATSDLSGFDSLALSENIANFPLPVITGIGHDRDQSIADMVAFASLKTPTAVAAFLVENLRQTLQMVETASQTIAKESRTRLQAERLRLHHASQMLPTLFATIQTREREKLKNYAKTLSVCSLHLLEKQHDKLSRTLAQMETETQKRLLISKQRVELLSERIAANDPKLLLRRGYSITLKDGHTVKDVRKLKDGDKIETRLFNGTIQSTVSK